MTAPFDPLTALLALREGGVDFIVIGGLAGRLHGSPTVTNDLDVCYRRSPDNLRRLAEALDGLGATLRGVDDEVPFVPDAATLAAGDSFTLVTTAGNLDVLGVPAGTDGYTDLVAGSVEMDLGGVAVPVASVDDLIRMKQAAGRPKDRVEMEILGALREEMGRISD